MTRQTATSVRPVTGRHGGHQLKVSELLGRADEAVLQKLLGRPAVELLALFDEGNVRPRLLRETILRLHSPQDLLLNPETRAQLLALLSPGEALELTRHLGLEADGTPAYAPLMDLRPRKGSTQEGRLLDYFQLVRKVPDVEPEPISHDVQVPYGLRPYQRSLVLRARTALDERPRLLVHMPTGAGKTRTTMSLICDHLRASEPTVVVWLAHSEELCQQAFEEFDRAWSALGNRQLRVARFWGSNCDSIEELRDGFIVCGLSKLYEATKRRIGLLACLADRTSLVIMDEAHQAIAESYSMLLEVLEGKRRETRLVGLTATPGRSYDDPTQNEALADFFYRRKVGIEVAGFDNPVDFLIQEQFLAEPQFKSLYYGGTEFTASDEREIHLSLDIPLSVLRKIGEDAKRNLQVVRAAETLVTRHRRVIIFAPSVESSDLLAAILLSRGQEAYSVTSQTSHSARTRTIGKFKSLGDASMIICNYGVLTTGFDVPATSAAIVARPTKSLVLYTQMIGRAVRGPKSGGNSSAEIVTVVDRDLPGFADFGEAFIHWEEPWT